MPVKVLADLRRRLDPIARKTSPLSVPPSRKTRFGSPLVLSRVHWVEPKLVAEITYLTWTADNLLRHTVYVGLREDKRSRPSAARSRAKLRREPPTKARLDRQGRKPQHRAGKKPCLTSGTFSRDIQRKAGIKTIASWSTGVRAIAVVPREVLLPKRRTAGRHAEPFKAGSRHTWPLPCRSQIEPVEAGACLSDPASQPVQRSQNAVTFSSQVSGGGP